MEGYPGSRPLRVALVAGLLLVGPVGPAAGVSAPSPASDTPVAERPGPVSAENELHVELALSVAPNATGAVTVRMTVENPESVVALTLDPTDRMTVRSTDGFELREGFYRWDGRTATPTVTYRLAVNRSAGAHLGAGVRAVDTGPWAVLAPPQAPVRYARIATYLEHGRTEVVESYEVNGEGILTDDVVYLGPSDTYQTFAGRQTIRLVVPRAAEMAVPPRRVLETLANASRGIRIGGRDRTVTGLAVPTTVNWSTGGSTTGTATFRVPASAPIRTAGSVWIHEYVHTRESVTTDRSMAWFTEAVATYYAAEQPLERGLIGFEDFRSTLGSGTSHTDVRLGDPGTWSYESDYKKGALVLGRLDLRIRAATNGTRTLDDAIRRLQQREGIVDADAFAQAVADVSSPEVGAAARRYVTTTATPQPWSMAEHVRSFGYAPARFSYALRDPRAVGPGWTRSLTATATRVQLLPSERLVVDAVVHNDGGTTGAYAATFRTVPGNVTDSRRVVGRLFDGWERPYPFTVRPNGTGTFFVLFGGSRSDQLKVQVVEPARNVTVSSVATAPSSISAGGTVTVTATVTNPNARPARATVPISVDGARVGSETVVLGGGGTTEIAADVKLDNGTHEIGVGSAGTTLRIGDPAPTTTSEATTDTAESTTSGSDEPAGTPTDEPTGAGSGPGFGVAATLLAGALLVAGYRHRR